MPGTYDCVGTSRPGISELSGSDPGTQRQLLLAVGVALSHIYQDVGISGTSGTNSRRGSVCLWCMDNLTLAVRAVTISPFAPTGWLVQWANKCLKFLVLPCTPQANGTPQSVSAASSTYR